MRQAGNVGSPHVVLETVGRKTSQPRQTPAGFARDSNAYVLWIVAQHGRDASYVRNIEANPHVRVRLDGNWRTGSARIVPDDDPLKRLGGYDKGNADITKRMGTSLLTVRIDLDPIS